MRYRGGESIMSKKHRHKYMDAKLPSVMPTASPLIKGALVAAALSSLGCLIEEEAESVATANMGDDTSDALVAPMPPPMVMPEQDMEIIAPMPPPRPDVTFDEADALPPMPPPREDMMFDEEDALPPMAPPRPDMMFDGEDTALPPMPPPMPPPRPDMMLYEADAELPPMPPPPMPPPREDPDTPR